MISIVQYLFEGHFKRNWGKYALGVGAVAAAARGIHVGNEEKHAENLLRHVIQSHIPNTEAANNIETQMGYHMKSAKNVSDEDIAKHYENLIRKRTGQVVITPEHIKRGLGQAYKQHQDATFIPKVGNK